MKVSFVKTSSNENVEYIFIGLDYGDDIDIIADTFCQEFDMMAEDKIDGFWYFLIKLKDNFYEYNLYWYECIGNYIYSVSQDEESNRELERRLIIVTEKLNAKLGELSKKKSLE